MSVTPGVIHNLIAKIIAKFSDPLAGIYDADRSALKFIEAPTDQSIDNIIRQSSEDRCVWVQVRGPILPLKGNCGELAVSIPVACYYYRRVGAKLDDESSAWDIGVRLMKAVAREVATPGGCTGTGAGKFELTRGREWIADINPLTSMELGPLDPSGEDEGDAGEELKLTYLWELEYRMDLTGG